MVITHARAPVDRDTGGQRKREREKERGWGWEEGVIKRSPFRRLIDRRLQIIWEYPGHNQNTIIQYMEYTGINYYKSTRLGFGQRSSIQLFINSVGTG